MIRTAFLILCLLALLPGTLHAQDADLEPDGDLDGEAECLTHDDCEAGYACEGGACVGLDANECRRNADCFDLNNMYCDVDEEACRYYCTSDTHCRPEEYCDQETYHCESLPDGDTEGEGFCTSDGDCGVDEFCDERSRVCRARCDNDSDCETGEKCESRRCVPASDGDEDTPWSAEADLEREAGFEVPEDYENPAVTPDGDAAEDEATARGGLSECPPGEVCSEDDGSGGSSSSGCVNISGGSISCFWILALGGLLAFRRREAGRRSAHESGDVR